MSEVGLPMDLIPEIKFSDVEHARFLQHIDVLFGSADGLDRAAFAIGRGAEEVLIHARMFFGNDLGGTWTNLELVMVRLAVVHASRSNNLPEIVSRVHSLLPYKSVESLTEKIKLLMAELGLRSVNHVVINETADIRPASPSVHIQRTLESPVDLEEEDEHAEDPDSKHRGPRKRAVPWTPEEHRQFLLGLEQLGKGSWCRIAREYVGSRTPAQVASHAQKFFLRQSATPSQRVRASIYDYRTAAEVPPQFPVSKRRSRSVGHALHSVQHHDAAPGLAVPASMRRNATWSFSLLPDMDPEPTPMDVAPNEFPPDALWADPGAPLPLAAYEAALQAEHKLAATVPAELAPAAWLPDDMM